MVPAKLAESAPAGTVMLVGTVRLRLLVERANAKPAAGLALLSVTVQMTEEAPISGAGLHVRELSTGPAPPTVTVPPLPASETALPAADDATVVTTLSAEVWEAVTVMIATTPSAIVVAFRPNAIQVYEPVPPVHVNDFPAAVNTGPAVAKIELMFAAGY